MQYLIQINWQPDMEGLGKMYLVSKKPNIKAAESKVIKERRGRERGSWSLN